MIRKAAWVVIGLTLLMGCGFSVATNLVQVYQQALVNDPTFKKAQADWLSAKESLPLAITGNGVVGTGLFPNLTASATYADNNTKISNNVGVNEGNYVSKSYTLALTQPIFNLSTWMQISSARYQVRAATAVYLAAAQSLMQRTGQAYFEVLRANAKLLLTLAQEKQFLHQLVTSEEKFKVGIISITGVYDAQASYDRSIANEIQDRNDLQDALEDLRAITGMHYKALVDLKAKIPLLIPKPAHIKSWVRIALRQNYVIQRDLNNLYAAHENIKVAGTQNLPTLNLTGSYSQSRAPSVNTPPAAFSETPVSTNNTGQVGLALNFPVFRGGFDLANIKQTEYQYLSASDQLAIDHRLVENRTRKAFLGIYSGVSQIKADQQSILSARNQLEATKAGYIVGTRTMVDVLDSVTTLTQAQLAYADDRYNYVQDILLLKQQAGTLSPADIIKLNTWLKPRIEFSLKQPNVMPRKQIVAAPQVKVDLLDVNNPEYTDPEVERESLEPPSFLKQNGELRTPNALPVGAKQRLDKKEFAPPSKQLEVSPKKTKRADIFPRAKPKIKMLTPNHKTLTTPEHLQRQPSIEDERFSKPESALSLPQQSEVLSFSTLELFTSPVLAHVVYDYLFQNKSNSVASSSAVKIDSHLTRMHARARQQAHKPNVTSPTVRHQTQAKRLKHQLPVPQLLFHQAQQTTPLPTPQAMLAPPQQIFLSR